MWVDARRNWHALFHAGSGQQLTQCSTSLVAAHTFSADGGKTWNSSAGGVEPYKPVVRWADGSQVYATMERPHAYFDAASGRMTYFDAARKSKSA